MCRPTSWSKSLSHFCRCWRSSTSLEHFIRYFRLEDNICIVTWRSLRRSIYGLMRIKRNLKVILLSWRTKCVLCLHMHMADVPRVCKARESASPTMESALVEQCLSLFWFSEFTAKSSDSFSFVLSVPLLNLNISFFFSFTKFSSMVNS